MKKFFLLSTVALMVACGSKASADPETTQEMANVQAAKISHTDTAASKKTVRDGYTFKTSFRMDENGQCDALILVCKSKKAKQEFVCEFNWAKDKDLLGEAGTITEEDIDFDGMPDLMVCLGDFGVNPGLFPSIFYAAFVWNDETQRFEQVEKLDGVPNIEIDPKQKVISSEYVNPVGDVFHEIYAWKSGKLELIEENTRNAFDDEEN